jgi:hypothetical protein
MLGALCYPQSVEMAVRDGYLTVATCAFGYFTIMQTRIGGMHCSRIA